MSDSNVNVMNQTPTQISAANGPRAESPLYHADLPSMAHQGSKSGGVLLREKALLGHLVLRASLQNESFVSGVTKVIGCTLPKTLQSSEYDQATIRWISPDEWLLIVPGEDAFEIESRLRDAIDGHYSIVNVSGGQTVLEISGENAIDVLMKSCHYDMHLSKFPVGKVVTSNFSQTQAVIRRTAVDSWELVIRRSFADYVWLWLQDASAEFGLVIIE